MSDSTTNGTISNGTHSPCPTFQLNDGSLPGSPDFLEMELQYVPVSESPKPSTRVAQLSPNQNGRRRSSFSAVVNIPTYGPRPENHRGIAICGLLCCAVPLGVIGLLCSLQVDPTYDDGDSERAERKSSQAKAFAMAAIIIGMLGFIVGSFYVIFFFLVPSFT